ncbi:unnamed protein product [Musa acuminata subsp. burmannicoides]
MDALCTHMPFPACCVSLYCYEYMMIEQCKIKSNCLNEEKPLLVLPQICTFISFIYDMW